MSNKEIKIKVIKLFIRFLKENEFYDNAKLKYLKQHNSNYNHIIDNVSKLKITYFEGYARHILLEMGYNIFDKQNLKIERGWFKFCKTNLLKQNVNNIWELFKQTNDYKNNEYLIQKYTENYIINNPQYKSVVPDECKEMSCLPIHLAYIDDIIKLLNTPKNLDISKYQEMCDNLPTSKFLKKWETFYENNVEIKY